MLHGEHHRDAGSLADDEADLCGLQSGPTGGVYHGGVATGRAVSHVFRTVRIGLYSGKILSA